VPELPIAEENDAPVVKSGNGNGHHTADAAVKSLKRFHRAFHRTRPPARNCGHVACAMARVNKCLNAAKARMLLKNRIERVKPENS